MTQTKSNTKGFTLVELMVVVAIIGILAAVLIPAIQGNNNQEPKEVIQYESTD